EVTYRFDGPNYVMTWVKPTAQFPISEYIVRRDYVIVDSPKTNVFSMKADWGGMEMWSVAAVDVAGNEGPATQIEPVIIAPGVKQLPLQVIGNDVLLYWDG